MKLNLTLCNQNTLSDYLNLDAAIWEPGTSRIKCELTNLDKYIDDAECEEIRIVDIIGYLDAPKLDNALNHWLTKLRKGGILVISDTDIFQTFLSFQKGDLNLDQFNTYIYGQQAKLWEFKKSGLTLHTISEVLANKGLKIIEKSLTKHSFLIKAQRV